MKISKKACILLFILIYMLYSQFTYSPSVFTQYSDEVVTIYFLIYIVLKLIKIKKLDKEIVIMIYSLIALFFVGIISNLYSGINKNIFYLLLDVICIFKIFICFIGTYMMCTCYIGKSTIRFLKKISAFFLIIFLVFGIISVFIDIGMSNVGHWGIPSYRFLFQYSSVFSMCTLFFLGVISSSNMNEKSKKRFLLIGTLLLILTIKGISLGCAACIIILLVYMKKNTNINIKTLIILFTTSVILCFHQIGIYFLNEKAPRAIFYKYAYITAKEYFPLGSGFATYGSSVITEIYSPLYIKYGFNYLNGMSQHDTRFLSDNYWPMVIGQFGILGIILILILFYCIFNMIRKTKCEKYTKIIMLSILIYIMIGSTASAIPTSSPAILLSIILAINIKIYKI